MTLLYNALSIFSYPAAYETISSNEYFAGLACSMVMDSNHRVRFDEAATLKHAKNLKELIIFSSPSDNNNDWSRLFANAHNTDTRNTFSKLKELRIRCLILRTGEITAILQLPVLELLQLSNVRQPFPWTDFAVAKRSSRIKDLKIQAHISATAIAQVTTSIAALTQFWFLFQWDNGRKDWIWYHTNEHEGIWPVQSYPIVGAALGTHAKTLDSFHIALYEHYDCWPDDVDAQPALVQLGSFLSYEMLKIVSAPLEALLALDATDLEISHVLPRGIENAVIALNATETAIQSNYATAIASFKAVMSQGGRMEVKIGYGLHYAEAKLSTGFQELHDN
ncbi:hypothetical protein NX059_003603 [Plenodomus lindquistii]|nr:hypothetical protein NX059_003603 [Plenodomus lindquistii]